MAVIKLDFIIDRSFSNRNSAFIQKYYCYLRERKEN